MNDLKTYLDYLTYSLSDLILGKQNYEIIVVSASICLPNFWIYSSILLLMLEKTM